MCRFNLEYWIHVEAKIIIPYFLSSVFSNLAACLLKELPWQPHQ